MFNSFDAIQHLQSIAMGFVTVGLIVIGGGPLFIAAVIADLVFDCRKSRKKLLGP